SHGDPRYPRSLPGRVGHADGPHGGRSGVLVCRRGRIAVTLFGHAGVIAGKDLRIEVRGRYAVGLIVPFAGTLLIAFGLSLGPGRTLLQQTAPGLLWLALLFASVLAFRRSYESEGEDGALEGLLLSPIDKASVFLGKA